MALSWSSKRKSVYLGVLIAIFGVCLFIFVWPYLTKEPTCFDRKQNGGESGIDCGGSCLLVCSVESYKLVTLWARAFPVSEGNYNLMAYVENQNREAGIAKMNYEFRAYDQDNIFLGRKEGSTFISSNDRTAIFEPGLFADNRIPARVDFSFTSIPVWIKINRDQKNALSISVEDKKLINVFEEPKLEAEVLNNTIVNMRYLDVYAILYDEEDNVINVSKTLVEELPKNGRVGIVFTWPEPLTKNPSRIDIFPQVDIFELGLE